MQRHKEAMDPSVDPMQQHILRTFQKADNTIYKDLEACSKITKGK